MTATRMPTPGPATPTSLARGGPGPVRRGEPAGVVGRAQRAAQRNRTRMALGLLVMLAAALGGGLAFRDRSSVQEVLVVRQRVPAGEAIPPEAVGVLRVGRWSADSMIDSAYRHDVAGRTAAVDLVPGSVLAPKQVVATPTVRAAEAMVGAALKDGQFPVELQAGDQLLVVILPTEATDSGDPKSLGAPIPARLISLNVLPDGGATASLAVAPDKAAAVAAAGARGRLSLVAAPR